MLFLLTEGGQIRNQMLHKLMQGLYYPAALGTGLVLLVYHLAGPASLAAKVADVRTWFAMLLLVYFSLSYVANERWAASYSGRMFGADIVEVVLILLAFYFLGFTGAEVCTGLRPFYLCLICVPLLHIAWSLQVRIVDWRLLAIPLLRVFTLGVGWYWDGRSAVVPWLVLLALASLTVWYASFKGLGATSTGAA